MLDCPPSHAGPPPHSSLASAPAFLQRSGDGRIPFALGAVARAQGLLRHGQTARRVSQRSSEFQSGAIADGTDSGLRRGDGEGSVSERGREAGQGSLPRGAPLRIAISVSGQSAECDWTLSAVPRTLRTVSRAWRSSRAG